MAVEEINPLSLMYPNIEDGPVGGTIDGKDYDAIFDPLNLTSIGQQSLIINESDISQNNKVAFIVPRNPAIGQISTNILIDNFLERKTGSLVLSVANYDQSVKGAIILNEYFSQQMDMYDIYNLNENGLLSELDINVNVDVFDPQLNLIRPSDENFVDDDLWYSDFGRQSVDMSLFIIDETKVKEIDVYPQREINLTGDGFIPTDKSFIGSIVVDSYYSDPGDTEYRSKTSDVIDEIFYTNSPGPIQVDYSAGKVLDGWGSNDLFDPENFILYGSIFNDTYLNVQDMGSSGQVLDTFGDDFYTGTGKTLNTFLVVDVGGSNFFDFTNLDSFHTVGLISHELWETGYRARNVDGPNDLYIGTQNVIDISGYQKFESVIHFSDVKNYTISEFRESGSTMVDSLSNPPSNNTLPPDNKLIENGGFGILYLDPGETESQSTDRKPSALFLDDVYSGFHTNLEEPVSRLKDISYIIGSGGDNLIDLTSSNFTTSSSDPDDPNGYQYMMISGEGGDDIIWGGEQHELLTGDDGNDILNGGRGDDQFAGGEGFDIFEFTQSGGNKVIRDFNPSEDKIELYVRPEDPTEWNFTPGDRFLSLNLDWGNTRIELRDMLYLEDSLNERIEVIEIGKQRTWVPQDPLSPTNLSSNNANLVLNTDSVVTEPSDVQPNVVDIL